MTTGRGFSYDGKNYREIAFDSRDVEGVQAGAVVDVPEVKREIGIYTRGELEYRFGAYLSEEVTLKTRNEPGKMLLWSNGLEDPLISPMRCELGP
jgi:hypothetical protein